MHPKHTQVLTALLSRRITTVVHTDAALSGCFSAACHSYVLFIEYTFYKQAICTFLAALVLSNLSRFKSVLEFVLFPWTDQYICLVLARHSCHQLNTTPIKSVTGHYFLDVKPYLLIVSIRFQNGEIIGNTWCNEILEKSLKHVPAITLACRSLCELPIRKTTSRLMSYSIESIRFSLYRPPPSDILAWCPL